MPSQWYNACGIAYRFYDDGAVEVQDQGAPSWANTSPEAAVLTRSWAKWGAAVLAASAQHPTVKPAWLMAIMHIESAGNEKAAAPCEPTYCPAIWNAGGCASQGGPEIYCAGGLMAFISATAAKYGRTIDYYVAHPADQIMDAADLIAKELQRTGGDMCATAKHYNGGSTCAGGGLVGMGGQGDYVSKFIRAANTFLNLSLPMPADAPGVGPTTQGIVVVGVLGAIAYMFADIRWDLTSRIARLLRLQDTY